MVVSIANLYAEKISNGEKSPTIEEMADRLVEEKIIKESYNVELNKLKIVANRGYKFEINLNDNGGYEINYIEEGQDEGGSGDDTLIQEGTIGTLVTEDKIKIGDYVNYTYDEAETYDLDETYYLFPFPLEQTQGLKWRILNINDDNSIDLVSAVPTTEDAPIAGPLGYNNGVFLLNDVCKKFYSNESLGVYARSIRREDIEAHYTQELKDAILETSSNGVRYGDSKTYSIASSYYPVLYAEENGSGINSVTTKSDGLNQSDYSATLTDKDYSQANSGLTVTQTNYEINFNVQNNIRKFKDDKIEEILFGDTSYFVATRSVSCEEGDKASFNVYQYKDKCLNGWRFMASNEYNRSV